MLADPEAAVASAAACRKSFKTKGSISVCEQVQWVPVYCQLVQLHKSPYAALFVVFGLFSLSHIKENN